MNSPRILVSIMLTIIAVLLTGAWRVDADSGTRVFQARLEGFQETPAISTNGTGTFQAKLNSSGTDLDYELQYSGLEGGNTLFAHVHIGQIGVAGGVMFFL